MELSPRPKRYDIYIYIAMFILTLSLYTPTQSMAEICHNIWPCLDLNKAVLVFDRVGVMS